MIRLKIDSKRKRITLLEVKLGSLKEVKYIVQQLDPDGWKDWVIESETEYINYTWPTYTAHPPDKKDWVITSTNTSDFDVDKLNKNFTQK